MIDTLVRKYVLPLVLSSSLSASAYAQGDLPDINLEQVASCQTSKDCYIQGNAEFNQRQYERAEALFRRAATLAPPGKSRAILLYNMGTTCLMRNKVDRASEYFRLYLDEDIETVQREMPEAPGRLDINSLLVGMELYQEGMNFFSQHQFPESIALYSREKEYFEQHPELALSNHIVTTLHLPLGNAYDKAGKFAEAHREYKLYVDTAPASVETPKVQERIQELEKLLAAKSEEEVIPEVPPLVLSPPPESFLQRHTWSLLTAGGAVALGVGALVNRLGANADYQDLHERCVGNNDCSPSDADGIKTRDTITAALVFGSAVVLSTAAFLFYIKKKKAQQCLKLQLNQYQEQQ